MSIWSSREPSLPVFTGKKENFLHSHAAAVEETSSGFLLFSTCSGKSVNWAMRGDFPSELSLFIRSQGVELAVLQSTFSLSVSLSLRAHPSLSSI